MIVVLKHNPNPEQLQSLITWLQEKGIIIHTSIGEGNMLLGLVGDTSKIDADLISALDIVEDVKRVQEPYKNANRKFHPEDTVVKVGNTQIGGGNLTHHGRPLLGGDPRSRSLPWPRRSRPAGATMLRGGAFKPRTSPYAFQGLQARSACATSEIAKEETGLPIVTEIMDAQPAAALRRMWTSSRSAPGTCRTSTFSRQLGQSATSPSCSSGACPPPYEEWLMSAEYIMAGGNEQRDPLRAGHPHL